MFDNRETIFIEANSWFAELVAEREVRDYTFTGVNFAVRRIQLGCGNQTLIVNCRGNFRNGTAAEQYMFDLGGVGTLRGYNFKEYTGNNRLLLSADYLFNGDFVPPKLLKSVPIISSLSVGLFADMGLVWFSDAAQRELRTGSGMLLPETGSRLRDVKTDAGVSLLVFGKLLRIDAAKRLDKRYKDTDFIWYLRLQPLQK
jgi:outer membrane protein assembly factor BamA